MYQDFAHRPTADISLHSSRVSGPRHLDPGVPWHRAHIYVMLWYCKAWACFVQKPSTLNAGLFIHSAILKANTMHAFSLSD